MTAHPHGLPVDENDDGFEIGDLAETDALLDRLAAREPRLDDLDDRLIASLAVLATEVDLDPVPVQMTRRSLRELDDWYPGELSDEAAVTHPMDAASFAAAVHRQRAVVASEGDLHHQVFTLAPTRTPESVPSLAAGLVDPGRTLKVRLLPAVAAAGGAVILTMGAAAALTGGQSLNPAEAISLVVDQITGVRKLATPEPSTSVTTPVAPAPTGATRASRSSKSAVSTGSAARVDPPKVSPSTIPSLDRSPSVNGGAQIPVTGSARPVSTSAEQPSPSASTTVDPTIWPSVTEAPVAPTQAPAAPESAPGSVWPTTQPADDPNVSAPVTEEQPALAPTTSPPSVPVSVTESPSTHGKRPPGVGTGKPATPPGQLKRGSAASNATSEFVPPGLSE